jgi:transketolase
MIKMIDKEVKKIRKHAVTLISLGRSSHIGSILSIADVFAILYSSILKYKTSKPKWTGRDV